MSDEPGLGPRRRSSGPRSTGKRDGGGGRQQSSAKAGNQTVTRATRSNHCGSPGVDLYVLAGNYFVYLNINSPNGS